MIHQKPTIPTVNRRTALQTLGLSALGLSFCRVGVTLAGEKVSEKDIAIWLKALNTNASQLRRKEISGLQWQEVMDRIYGSVPLGQLKKHLEFDSLSKRIIEKIPKERSELFHRVKLQGSSEPNQTNGSEPYRALVTKVAYIKKGRSIPPHGHSNMASAFLCLSGEFEVRQYDRLEEQQEHMIVRQTAHEKKAGAGTWSSISDYRNNVHWLKAKTDDCFLFTCKLINLEENRKLKGRINIDVHNAKTLGSNTLKAPKISSRKAAELYS